MVSATTQGITVTVENEYSVHDSVPHKNQYLFVYKIKIYNESEHEIKLMSRKWLITNGIGESHVVEGIGVVGIQPEIMPGYMFDYRSYCVLATPLGYMQGSYQMQLPDGSILDVEIPKFKLEALTLMN